MKTQLATLLLSLCFTLPSPARLIVGPLDYESQTDKATLIVIATPTKVADTAELAALPNIVTVHIGGTNEPVMAKGIETTFQVLTVLKGEHGIKSLTLHHFKLAKEEAVRNGPGLVAFEPNNKKRYVMFLQKETDGRYVAVCGQTDPTYSIRELVDTYP